jgi:DNA-binding NtrC family response regulator
MGAPDSTLTLRPEPRGGARTTSAPDPHVLLAFDCDRPTASSTRYSLRHVEEATFGRAADRRFAFVDGPTGRQLSVGIPDVWMSKTHATLRRNGEHWTIEDADSKNGTIVNGSSVARALLAPGDLIELGRTLLLYGDGPPPSAATEPVVDSASLKLSLPGFPTWNRALGRVLAELEAIAASAVPVVIHGESGTGKELIARAIHQASRRSGPMLAVNCGAISEKLVESELFGHRRGAFTGADEDRPGFFRSADRGTLLLDEIGELPQQAQAALLRVMQEQEVVSVGATHPVKVSVRVVSATQRDLKAIVAQGRFRADLLARLAGFSAELPPLRDRREDLGLLIGILLRRLSPADTGQIAFTGRAARALFTYGWPLNVRELEQALRAGLVLAGKGPVDLEHLPASVRTARHADAAPSEPATVAKLAADEGNRREQLVELFQKHAGNVSAVAREIGKTRAQVHRWIRRYALQVQHFRR